MLHKSGITSIIVNLLGEIMVPVKAKPILYLKDWNLYPRAIADINTKNKSFVDICYLFKEMGIKNHLFPLALIQPELQGIDYFNPDMDEATATKVRIECEINPWFFIREILRFYPLSGEGSNPVICNRAVIGFWWALLNHYTWYGEQPRQTGKSVNADGFYVWYGILKAQNSRYTIFTKDGDLVRTNIERLKRMRSLLPKYLWNITKEDSDNQKEFTNMFRRNRLVAVQAQGNEVAALNVGRGISTGLAGVDEIAFLKYNWISVPAMLAGCGAAKEEAARKGEPYGTIITTTAGKLDDPAGEYAYNIRMSGMPHNEVIYDTADAKESAAMILKNSRSEWPLITGVFNHRQLGYTDQWLRARISAAMATGDDVRRDFLMEWTYGSKKNPLPTAVIDTIRKSAVDPSHISVYRADGYLVRWYIPKEEVLSGLRDRQIVMGMDTSNACGRDSITGVGIDISTLEVVMTFNISETNLQTFSQWLAKFIAEYKNITLIPENKSTWVAIQDYLFITLPNMGVDPGKRIYNLIVDRKRDSEADRREYENFIRCRTGNQFTRYKSYFGFTTDRNKRELIMTSVLQDYAQKVGNKIRDNQLIDQITGLQYDGKRVDHAPGGHDDMVFSWLMAMWFLTYGKNLEHYGIRLENVKRRLLELDDAAPWKERKMRDDNHRIREELRELLNDLTDCKDPYLTARLTNRINSLSANLDLSQEDNGQDSIEVMLRNVREKNSVEQKKNQQRPTTYRRENDNFVSYGGMRPNKVNIC